MWWPASFKEFYHTRQPPTNVSLSIGNSPTVKRFHRELCPWLTDTLSGNDADGHVTPDKFPCGQITPVALLADPVGCLTCEYRANTNGRDTRGQQIICQMFIDQLAC